MARWHFLSKLYTSIPKNAGNSLQIFINVLLVISNVVNDKLVLTFKGKICYLWYDMYIYGMICYLWYDMLFMLYEINEVDSFSWHLNVSQDKLKTKLQRNHKNIVVI